MSHRLSVLMMLGCSSMGSLSIKHYQDSSPMGIHGPPKAHRLGDWWALLIITLSRVVMLSPATTCSPSRIGANISLCTCLCGDASAHPPLQFAVSIMQVPTISISPSDSEVLACESSRSSHHVPLRQIILDGQGSYHAGDKDDVDMCSPDDARLMTRMRVSFFRRVLYLLRPPVFASLLHVQHGTGDKGERNAATKSKTRQRDSGRDVSRAASSGWQI
ncbi:hypothetical protein V8C42DRAFT_326378 [Trichoderma barbatum]